VRPIAALASTGFFLLASAAHAAESEKGMPQLDFSKGSLTLAQVVWGAIIFFALYTLLAKWALPQVAGVLEARATAIGNDLEAARRAKAEADAAVAELTSATRAAQNGAQAEIATALAQAKQAAGSRAAELNAKLDAQIEAADARINAARVAALGALREVASDAASNVVARLTGTLPANQVIEQAVGQALAARGQA